MECPRHKMQGPPTFTTEVILVLGVSVTVLITVLSGEAWNPGSLIAGACFVCDLEQGLMSIWVCTIGLSYWLNLDVASPVPGSSIYAISFKPSRSL